MSTFLPALLGEQPADIHIKAVVGTDLEHTLTTRALAAWISVVGSAFEGCLPGTDHLVKFERDGLVYRGEVGGRGFSEVTAPWLLRALAQVLDVGDAMPREEGAVAKFCKSLDGMIHAAWTLEKTSKNVKQKRAEITRAQADQRRERYARSLGLEPKRAIQPEPVPKQPTAHEWYHQDGTDQSVVKRFDAGSRRPMPQTAEKTEMAPTFVAPRRADQPTPPVGPKQPRQPRAPKPPGDDRE